MARKPGQRLRPEEATTKRPTRTLTKKADIIAGLRKGFIEGPKVDDPVRRVIGKGVKKLKEAASTRTRREIIQDIMTPLPIHAGVQVAKLARKAVGKGVQKLKKAGVKAGVKKVLKVATPLPLQGDLRAKGPVRIAAEFMGMRVRPIKEKKEPRKQARIRRGP